MEQEEQSPDEKEDSATWFLPPGTLEASSLLELSKRIASASSNEAGVERNFSAHQSLGAQPK